MIQSYVLASAGAGWRLKQTHFNFDLIQFCHVDKQSQPGLFPNDFQICGGSQDYGGNNLKFIKTRR